MACGVYQLTFTSGSRYIGSSVRLRGRLSDHRRLLRRGAHENPAVQNSYNKHGEPFVRLLIICRPEDTIMYEQLCLDSLKPELNCSTVAGKIEHTPEVVSRMREAALKPDRRKASSERMKTTLSLMTPSQRLAAQSNRLGSVQTENFKADCSAFMKDYAARVGSQEMSRRAKLQTPIATEIRSERARKAWVTRRRNLCKS